TLLGHTNDVTAAAFSANGRILVSASADKTIRFWDSALGTERQRVDEDVPVSEVRFTPDCQAIAYVATMGQDRVETKSDVVNGQTTSQVTISRSRQTLKLMEIATSKTRTFLSSQDHDIGFMSFSCDGRMLAAMLVEKEIVAEVEEGAVAAGAGPRA